MQTWQNLSYLPWRMEQVFLASICLYKLTPYLKYQKTIASIHPPIWNIINKQFSAFKLSFKLHDADVNIYKASLFMKTLKKLLNISFWKFTFYVSPWHISSGNGLKCYAGKRNDIHEDGVDKSPVKLENCTSGFDMCTTAEYIIKGSTENASVKVSIVQGMCSHQLLGCNFLCDQLQRTISRIASCKVSWVVIYLFWCY